MGSWCDTQMLSKGYTSDYRSNNTQKSETLRLLSSEQIPFESACDHLPCKYPLRAYIRVIIIRKGHWGKTFPLCPLLGSHMKYPKKLVWASEFIFQFLNFSNVNI